MLGNPVSQTLIGNQAQIMAQMLAQSHLDQARMHKAAQNFELALILCDQAKVNFKFIADARQLFPSLSEAKSALNQARMPQTYEEETLRHRIAEVYVERAELLEKLGKSDKAQASYKKAQAWGYEGIKLTPTALIESLSVQDAPASAQKSTSTLVSLQPSSAHEKSDLVDYLFEKALLTLSSLEVSKKPSLFLVYAHDNDAHGEAKASTSKYLINNLSKIRGVTLYSDQTPIGQAYSSSVENLKEDGKLEDILTNQFCLLPAQVRADVKPVDKVIVCCSDVLGSYLKGQSYKAFCDELKKAYDIDREAYVKDNEQKGTPALREVVRKFSQEEKYMADFHHVLTEMAFLEIRAAHLKGQHGIIPVSLTPNSYDYCLKDFIDSTTVRMEDPLRFDLQVKKGEEVYLNQGSHGVLFKVIERLLAGSNEAKTFLDKFWTGHSHVISRLKSDANFGKLEFAKLLDGIFDGIRTAMHSQLASTVQQEHEQLQVFRADPKAALKEQYAAALTQDEAFQETLKLYVESRCRASLNGESQTFELLPQVQVFLKDKKVILLTGDSGAGKTTFNRRLEKLLWDHKKEEDAIPLFISLPSIDKPEQDLIAKALKKRGLSEFQIQKLKKANQRFVFILDGYDEIRQTQNLYLSNGINHADGWQGQMVISCRSEYLGQDYRSRFQPNPMLQDKDTLFQEIVVEPFSKEERDQYLEKYVAHNLTDWTAQAYQEAFSKQSNLKDLISNPFLLRVVLEALPYIEKKGKAVSAIQLRLNLYDQFVKQWFERNQQRLSTQSLTGAQKEVFRELNDDGFAQHGLGFVKELAVHLYKENAGNPIVEYSLFKDKGSWKDAFFGREEENQLLREAWPVVRSGNQYRFIHKSVLEYWVARSLFESFDACTVADTRARRGSDASVYSFEEQAVLPSRTERDLSLAPKHWVSDLGIVRLLTERVQQEKPFKKQLLSIIERSKSDKTVRQAAANAMTILVRAGVQFHGMDLKGIQIPGADLSGGAFDSAHLQRSDLRNVKLRTSWLYQANLSEAQMAGVQFGEWPYLEEEDWVYSCVYSPDGKTCATGIITGVISVYNTLNWDKIHTLRGHKLRGRVTSVVYSPSGAQIASGSWDQTIRLWDAHTGAPGHILEGHTDRINSVVYSPSGAQIASGSHDQTVRLWDAHTGAPGLTLEGHTDLVNSVVYSPSGAQIASGSTDRTVRLWDAHTGAAGPILVGHIDRVNSVVYSPSGAQIASGSHDQTVRLWDAHTGAALHTLEGHTGWVHSVVYSPSGAQIASGSTDRTVRLWDAHSRAAGHTLEGHTNAVLSVVYSPSGAQIASGSGDKTVRLWDAHTGAAGHTLEGHTNVVLSVVYSPSGAQIASGSDDRTVRLWDAYSGKAGHTLEGHTNSVYSVVYSPSGAQIASGSNDQTVRLWDAHTGAPGLTLEGHTDAVRSVVYSPSGAQIASGSNDQTVRLWDAHTGAPGHTLEGHTDAVRSVVYSPSGAQIASGSRDNTVRLWDAHTGAALHALEGHTGWVRGVVYSLSGAQIASGSWDNTVRLWDVASGECLRVIEGFSEGVNSVAWKETLESVYLLTGSGDKFVRQWQVVAEGTGYHARLRWMSPHAELSVTASVVDGVRGLSEMNKKLLKQRGMVVDPLTLNNLAAVESSPSADQSSGPRLNKTLKFWSKSKN